MAPMEFDRLVETLIPEGSELKSAVLMLLARKKSGEELDDEPRIQCINDFLEERIEHFEQAARGADDTPQNRDRQLDTLFRAALREVWG